MSSNARELFTAPIGLEEPLTFRPERRKRVRTQVHWPVLLMGDHGSKAVETVTQNLSSTGFYCISPTPFSVGESLVCALKVPAYDPVGQDRTLALECKVEVVRAEPLPDGSVCGVACRIHDYHLIVTGPRSA